MQCRKNAASQHDSAVLAMRWTHGCYARDTWLLSAVIALLSAVIAIRHWRMATSIQRRSARNRNVDRARSNVDPRGVATLVRQTPTSICREKQRRSNELVSAENGKLRRIDSP